MAREKKATGRPLAAFDYGEVERLASLGCTDEEMGDFFQCSAETIRVNKLEDPCFLESYKKGKGDMRISLRRRQIKAAEEGNATMLIWLGKQLLGQADKTEITGAHGGPIAHTNAVDPKQYTKQEAVTLEALIAKGTDTTASASN